MCTAARAIVRPGAIVWRAPAHSSHLRNGLRRLTSSIAPIHLSPRESAEACVLSAPVSTAHFAPHATRAARPLDLPCATEPTRDRTQHLPFRHQGSPPPRPPRSITSHPHILYMVAIPCTLTMITVLSRPDMINYSYSDLTAPTVGGRPSPAAAAAFSRLRSPPR